jgi:hypothetical protein
MLCGSNGIFFVTSRARLEREVERKIGSTYARDRLPFEPKTPTSRGSLFSCASHLWGTEVQYIHMVNEHGIITNWVLYIDSLAVVSLDTVGVVPLQKHKYTKVI